MNPLVSYLFNRMAFKVWRNYSHIKIEEHLDTPITEEDEADEDLYSDQDSQDFQNSFVNENEKLHYDAKNQIDEEDENHSLCKKVETCF